ncbi:hypothetical protein NMY22_g4081 [Coprinellus aureogranulatus]|nr:hypothetical protein NMY22_g4081 [Coprinellus aureogranulatus]
MGISAWIVPTTHDSQKLEKIMKPKYDTSHLKSKTSFPTFDPHVTLASSIPADKSLEEIRKALGHSPSDTNAHYPDSQAPNDGKFKVEFAKLQTGDKYTQSVFIRCKETPDIMDLHSSFHKNLGIEVKTPLFPHLSVAYIEDGDAEQGERDRFVKELKEQGRVKEAGDSVSLLCAMPDEWVDGFEAAEVWIVKCDGPVREWEVLDRIKL